MKNIFLITAILSVSFASANSDLTMPGTKSKNHESLTTTGDTIKPKLKQSGYTLDKFLEENLTYPQSAFEKGLSGKVYVSLIVDTAGMVDSVIIFKSSGHPELDEEAVRVIKKTSGKWIPASVDGNNVIYILRTYIVFEYIEE